MTMPMTAITLAIQIITIRSNTLDKGDTPLPAKEIRAKMKKIKKEDSQAVVMFLA
jgi:hypothetical protein